MSAALGGWIALTTLGLIGFDPQLGRENSAEHMLGLRMLFTIPPSLLFFTAAALIWNYPITEKRHRRMREALARRNVRRSERRAVSSSP
jgi:GPH family glycoside/pentoside/hexuronide:cation symporter